MITFLALGKYGRIGNQLFRVASTIGIARRTTWGASVAFHNWDHPFDRKNWRGVDRIADPPENWEMREVPWGYHEVDLPEGDWDVLGYLQSEKYFKHCEAEIREKFTFKKQLEPMGEFISVHVRRGDYVKLSPEYFNLLDADYYGRALSMLPKDIPIYVFSDDVAQAKRAVPWGDVFCSAPDDLQRMTMASYHVIANSSFSWWGAWLSSSKKVIAPKEYFGPENGFCADDIYCEGWEVI